MVAEAPFGGRCPGRRSRRRRRLLGTIQILRTLTLTNKGQAGVGTTVVGTLAFTTGNNGVAFDEKPLVLSVVAGCYQGGGGRHSGRGGDRLKRVRGR